MPRHRSIEGRSMSKPQLFPRLPKKLRQPRKAVLREQLRLAADRIIELRAENDRLRWWNRMFRRNAG